MSNDESTIFGTAAGQQENQQQKMAASKGWQQVTIGGVTGIMMGAAGMYAANAFAGKLSASDGQSPEGGLATGTTSTQSHTTDEGLHVAEVDQSLSFGEAFAAARAEVGSGGVFHWHGGIYNTYTTSEWNSMSDSEHAQFAQQVQPEIRPGEEHTGQRDTAHHSKPEPKPDKPDDDDSTHGHGPNPKPVKDDEPEVHFLGVERVETEHGVWNVGRMVQGDQEVALVDVDDDMVFDVSVSDRNNNGEIERHEVEDISSRNLSVTDFAVISATQNPDGLQPDVANNTQQNHLADDMPDYMNDADIPTV